MTDADLQSGWFDEETATFGDRLAAAREQAGLSQEKLAVRLGVKPVTLAAWEEDRKEPRANRLTMLAGMLGISLSWLMTGEGEGPDGSEDTEITPEIADILAQMRKARVEITRANDRIARLEKQLRKAMQSAA